MANWGVDCPVIAMLSIFGADDVTLGTQGAYGDPETAKFDRRVLALPDTEPAGEGPDREELRPLFDLVWQSAGFQWLIALR